MPAGASCTIRDVAVLSAGSRTDRASVGSGSGSFGAPILTSIGLFHCAVVRLEHGDVLKTVDVYKLKRQLNEKRIGLEKLLPFLLMRYKRGFIINYLRRGIKVEPPQLTICYFVFITNFNWFSAGTRTKMIKNVKLDWKMCVMAF